jgi:hypothetical protein
VSPDSSEPEINGAAQAGRAVWAGDYDKLVHGRLERVQASAQQWLSTITALLGLFSAAIVVGGATSVGDLSMSARRLVFAAAVTVYTLAFLAVVLGAAATFGGLGTRQARVKELIRYATSESQRADVADATYQQCRQRADREPDRRSEFRILADAACLRARQGRSQAALASARAEQLAAASAGVSRLERRRLQLSTRWRGFWGSNPSDGDAFDYRFRYEQQADTRRARLHKSRALGVTSAVLSGALAMTLLWHQTRTPSTPSLSLLVIRHGAVQCLTIPAGQTESTPLPGAADGVTQITVVPRC